MTKYQFTDDMQEISGFGGSYEECCRRMLSAALVWLDEHPDAAPEFTGWKGVYGVVREDNADAKALSAAAVGAAADYGATGAMHHAVVAAAMWVRANGWAAYVCEKTHPGGQVGILKDKVAKLEDDLKKQREWSERLMAESQKRGFIIAERVLGWQKHKTSNNQQEAYGPDRDAVLTRLYAGSSLFKLVDEAIDGMEVAA